MRVNPRHRKGFRERGARRGEQILEDRRHRQQRRPGVEAEAVARVRTELSADHARRLADGDVVAERVQARGGREPTETRADDDDSGHPAAYAVRTPATVTERPIQAR